jgi:hypothetical protein
VAILDFAACASAALRPQHGLAWRVEDFRSEQLAEGLRWTYSLVLENRGRLGVEVIRGFAATAVGTAQASPEQIITSTTIAPGGAVRVPHEVLIRGADFNLTDRTAIRRVRWQFWTKYADGHSEIVNADVRP